MPHLSPMKWFLFYYIMIFWMLIIMIKMNFLFMFYPKKTINKKKKLNLYWTI